MVDLFNRDSHEWLHNHIVDYADDVHLRWCLQCITDGLSALNDLFYILHMFHSFDFNINASISVVLFRAVDKGMAQNTKYWICQIANGPQLVISDSPFRLPMVARTAYLGFVLIIELGKRIR